MRILLFGTFDCLHPGHRFVIEEGMKRGDVTVIVARDVTVERIKKRPAQQPENERRRLLVEAYPSITILLGETQDYLAVVRRVRPDLILLGYDQQLPPGTALTDFPCPIERLPAFEPGRWKSSKMRDEDRETQ